MYGEFQPLPENDDNDSCGSDVSDCEEQKRRRAFHNRPHISRLSKFYRDALQEQEGHNIEESSTRVLHDENAIYDVTDDVNVNIEEDVVGNMIRAFFDGGNNNKEPNEPTKEEKLLREQSTAMLFHGPKTP